MGHVRVKICYMSVSISCFYFSLDFEPVMVFFAVTGFLLQFCNT